MFKTRARARLTGSSLVNIPTTLVPDINMKWSTLQKPPGECNYECPKQVLQSLSSKNDEIAKRTSVRFTTLKSNI